MQKLQHVRAFSRLVVLVRAHPVVDDPRVEKEVRSLTANGFQVTILAWDRTKSYSKFERSSGRTIFRLRLGAPYGKWVIAAYYPLFWLWVLKKLFENSPRLIHACDMDTIFPALLYVFLRRQTRVILDMFDSHAMTMLERSELLGRAMLGLERFAAARSDAVVCVSGWILSVLFDGVALKRTEIIENFPDLNLVSPDPTCPYRHKRIFRLVFAGTVGRYRGIIEMTEALRDLDDVELLVAGRIADRRIFDTIMRFRPVKYCGPLKYQEALSLEASSDVLPVLYDLNSPWYRRQSPGVSPNKLYEAMMLGIPIITNLSGILQGVDCGVFVEYGDVLAIKKAIIYLKDHPDIRCKLGQNGKIAFERNFNWKLMEKKLIALYQELIGEGAGAE